MIFKREKYYLISYSHSEGFGNVFFKENPYLDIRAAEKEIEEKYEDSVVIISINKISKGQFRLHNES